MNWRAAAGHARRLVFIFRFHHVAVQAEGLRACDGDGRLRRWVIAVDRVPAPDGDPARAQSLDDRGSDINPGGIYAESLLSISDLDKHVAQAGGLCRGQDGVRAHRLRIRGG